MNALNLPPYDVKIKQEGQRTMILDILRRKYVALTPEEWVRQHFIHFLMNEKGYPSTLLQNEIELRCGDKKMRCDSVLFKNDGTARMIMEYKAPTINITQEVFNQIASYNVLLRVEYLIVSNGINHYCCKMDYENNSYRFLEEIPGYKEL